MGDGDATASQVRLSYVPREELDRIHKIADPTQRAAAFATATRINIFYMIKRAGSGHVGTSFSSIDLLSWLFLEELKLESERTEDARDVFFSSKGHDAPAFYSLLCGLGLLPFESLHKLRQIGGLPGHPHVEIPYVYANTGSLGMGISKAKGMLAANRLLGKDGRVFVLTGDGELQEGQIWESLQGAARDGLDGLYALVDRNAIQSDTWVRDVNDLGDLEAKFRAFDWHVERCDGHDMRSFSGALARAKGAVGKPKVILADTIKGRGIPAMEGIPSGEWRYRYHSGAPPDELYAAGLAELRASLDQQLRNVGAPRVMLVDVEQPAHRVIEGMQRLLPAYTSALLDLAERRREVVAVDADLILDTGLIPFRERFPARFLECGIAEQDMVSQAGGLALRGMLPIVHSFSSFLSARPNEQIANNASEGRKVLYVGSLAGLLPGGPGHSHQAVRDISALAAIPDLVMAAPSCDAEVAPLLEELAQGPGSGYLRLVSVAWDVPFRFPAGYSPSLGKGVEVRPGRDGVLIAYGPWLVSEAYRAATALSREGIDLAVIALPWLNRVDPEWLRRTLDGRAVLVTLDDHYVEDGQGARILTTLAELNLARPPRALRLGVRGLPACGKNDEVLRYHRLDAAGIAHDVAAFVRKGA